MIRPALVIGWLAIATSARADVWKDAIDTGSPDVIKEIYARQMRAGDDETIQATSRSITPANVTHHLALAVQSYRTAATTRPTEGEPYFRIGTLLYRFIFDCVPNNERAPITCDPSDLRTVADIVTAWDAFEARSPLDPRVNNLLFSRAILRTKLIDAAKDSKPLLEGAARDYQAAIDRRDGLTLAGEAEIWGNLAETYMMLDRLDDAVTAYREALRTGASVSVTYGLAVALDRDERSLSARDLIVDAGMTGFQAYEREIEGNSVFYVPAGEEHYYFALVEESLGMAAEATVEWKKYIASGAHPEFQPRARQHLDALAARNRIGRAIPPPTPDELER